MESGYISFQGNRDLAQHGSTVKRMEKSFLFGSKKRRSQYEKVKHTWRIQIFLIQFDDHFFQQQSIFASLFVPLHPLSRTSHQAEKLSQVKALPLLFRSGSFKSTAVPDLVLATAHVTQRAGSAGLRHRSSDTGGWAQPGCCPGHWWCCTYHQAVAQHRHKPLSSSAQLLQLLPRAAVSDKHGQSTSSRPDTGKSYYCGWGTGLRLRTRKLKFSSLL